MASSPYRDNARLPAEDRWEHWCAWLRCKAQQRSASLDVRMAVVLPVHGSFATHEHPRAHPASSTTSVLKARIAGYKAALRSWLPTTHPAPTGS